MDSASEQQFLAWASSRMKRLQRTAFLLSGDWHVAEDLVQEALARTALHWKRVASKGEPDAYIRKVLVNLSRQRWRRRSSRMERLFGDIPEINVPDGATERAVRAELLAALRLLPDRQRATLVLRYFEQLTEAETASALGCSVGTVKSATHRALNKLNELLTYEVNQC